MITENLKATGTLTIKHLDGSGKLINSYDLKNLVVTTGKNYFTSRAVGVAKPVMSHMALGSGTTAASLPDTSLQTQISTRVTLGSTVLSNNIITYETTFGPGICTGAITEAGIFNAATLGDMLCRTTFSVVNKAAPDTIIITWNVTLN